MAGAKANTLAAGATRLYKRSALVESDNLISKQQRRNRSPPAFAKVASGGVDSALVSNCKL